MSNRAIAVVLARAASKRLPGKVLRPLGDHPLLAWMARTALNSMADRVILSTEDETIAQVAKDYGLDAPFLRPAALASDTARNDAVLLHAVQTVEARGDRPYDICVLLQSTGPFAQPDDIDRCIAALVEDPTLNAAFAARPVREQPAWMFQTDPKTGTAKTLLGGDLIGARQLTQSLSPCFLPAGTVWAVRRAALEEVGGVYAPPLRMIEVPEERSIDIDEEIDLIHADTVRRHFGFTLLAAPT